jgi:hypothetical protein
MIEGPVPLFITRFAWLAKLIEVLNSQMFEAAVDFGGAEGIVELPANTLNEKRRSNINMNSRVTNAVILSSN